MIERRELIKLMNLCERLLSVHKMRAPNDAAYALLYGEHGPAIQAADIKRIQLLSELHTESYK